MDKAQMEGALRRVALAGLLASGLLAMSAATALADDGPGIEVKGPEVEFEVDVMSRQNVQVIAGPAASDDDNSQTASNSGDVEQDQDANAGEPNASNFGVAVSGPGIAGTVNIGQQTNVQVIAGWTSEDGGVQQDASNEVGGSQGADATSGDPSADGLGSLATTGAAMAFDLNVSSQTNIQTFVGVPGDQ